MANPGRREFGQRNSSAGVSSPQQNQNSRQSAGNASGAQQGGRAQRTAEQVSRQKQSGIGASQAQDRGSPDLDKGAQSNTSADIERPGQGDSRDSLVNDPTGAFKERP